MRIYVASSWRNSFQPVVVRHLREDGHEVYDFRNPPHGVEGLTSWSNIDPNYEKWSAEDYRRALTTSPIAALGYTSDLRGMELWADACCLVLPCGRSAHLEAGWFAGRGKRLVVLTQDGEEPELMALMAHHICVSLDEARTALRS